MSRILRRPMFRGGGSVDSYGTGIAAPLVPGYRMGGNVRGGIVDLPGGYNLTANERALFNASDMAAMSNSGVTKGIDLLKRNQAITSGAVPFTSKNIPGVVEEDKTVTTDEESKTIEEIMKENNQYPSQDYTKENEITIDDKIESYTPKPNEKLIELLTKESTFVDEDGVERSTTTGKIVEKKVKSDVQDANKDMKSFPRDVEIMGAETDATLIGGDEDGSTGELGEATEMTAKDAIAQNQALFAELLGADKARGQDIGDMLLRFSGSQGNTVGEKFQNYTRAESAAGPSRSEKIKQTAAGLAINDYVAGKRSKEQIEALKTKIDYTQDKKNAALQLTVNDDLSMAKAKASKLTDKGINSDETTKALIQTKVGTGVPVFRAQIKFKDVEKKKDKLKQGYNLVDDEGTTRIVIYDGNNVNVVGTIDEFWSS